MKLGLAPSFQVSSSFFGFAVLAAGAVACSGSSSSGGPLFKPGGADAGGGSSPSGGSGANPGGSSSNDPPHALGTIALGEAHASGTSSSLPLVSASFWPDAAQLSAASACTTTLAGCTLPLAPVCDGTSGPLCGSGQTCALDPSTCRATCTQACTLDCGSGKVCYFAEPNAPACRNVETFDAGALAFAGTTTPITLFPPYSFQSSASGAPFLGGAALEVQGSGATAAGFAPFDETFTATTFLQTSPSLSTLTTADVFSPGGFAVGWVPGGDLVRVSVTGPKGSASCPATDAMGAFTVPAAVITAVAGMGSPAISVSVSRQRVEQKTDAKTRGMLATATVQPIGYLELTTSSTETFTVAGCASGQATCGGVCTDLQSSPTNCGACGRSCGGGYCSGGTCYGTTPSCLAPLVSCDDGCVDLQVSPSNCGACGVACASGESCAQGACTPSGSSCGALASCSDGCADVQTSTTDCGACGNACAPGQSCDSGICTAVTSDSCTACEQTAYAGACASAESACPAGSQCDGYIQCSEVCALNDPICSIGCQSSYPSGVTPAETLFDCVCKQQCATPCASSAFCGAVL
ncbi:MAG TPA: hypothetical protein VGI39_02405 [Polyangiaceae bacterium]